MDDKNHSNLELIMYILVNEDLKMSTGKISAQVGHVITNFLLDHSTMNEGGNHYFSEYQQDLMTHVHTWHMGNQKKIILKAPQKLLEELENTYWSIRDNGLTEIKPNSLTAICLGINTRENFLKAIPKLKRLRLL